MPLDNTTTAPYVRQSATLLASQPLTPPRPGRKEPAEWGPVFTQLERRLQALRSWRWTWWAQWTELGAYFLPRRMKTFVVANQYSRGRFLNDQIIDSTPVQAMNTCASGMWSGLTNPAKPWFRFGLAVNTIELDQAGKDWLVNLQNRTLAVLHQSNFYSTMAQLFQDVTVFGTSPVIIYEDKEDVIRCYLPCAGEYFLQVGSRLSVDTLYREFTLTVGQIVEMFTLENCPNEVQKLWEEGAIDREFIVAHAIEPNFAIRDVKNRRHLSPVPGRFPFREVYWLRGQKNMGPLSVRGFHEKPFMVARWWIVSNDAYGRSPCMDALGDNKQIQLESLRKAEFIEKLVRPPMTAPPELKNEPASIMPGMITFVNTANGKPAFTPAFEMQPQGLPAITADIEKVTARIKDALYVPQFMAITQMQGVQPRNELELTKRDLEKLQILGPVIDLFENEVAGPAIQRIVNIMTRRGMIPPPPPSLQNVPLKIEYQSLMRIAQRAAESVSMKDGFTTMGSLSLAAKNAGVPDPIRTINLDGSLKHYLDLINYPVDLIYSKEQVEQNDAIKLKELKDQQQAQNVSDLSKPAVDAAKVLSQTEVGGGSYLSSILSGNVGQ